jgi:molecular chaperone GrpE (heat shock protein)
MVGSDLAASDRVAGEEVTESSQEHSLDQLAEEIAELSAHIDAATWRLLKAIAEFET